MAQTNKELPKDGWGVAPELINEPANHYYREGAAVAQIVPAHGAFQPYTIPTHHAFLGSGRVTLGPPVATLEEAKTVVEGWIEETKEAAKGSPAVTKKTDAPKPAVASKK